MAAKWIKNILCIYIAIVFVQSLFFKFTDSFETVYIFSILGSWSGFDWFAEYGAYAVGTAELIAAILLFSPLRLYGAGLASGIMTGAVYFHLFTPLGIDMPEFDEVGNITGTDGGLLFYSACGVLISAVLVTAIEFFGTDNALKRTFFS